MTIFENSILNEIKNINQKGNLSTNLGNSNFSNNTESIVNNKSCTRDQYILSLVSIIFDGFISMHLLSDFSELFVNYLECENKFYYRDKITDKLYHLLQKIFHNDINKFSMALKRVQHVLKNGKFENPKFKNDLCRLERFFLNLILRKHVNNLVRGHRKYDL
jgi:hypothetical protein